MGTEARHPNQPAVSLVTPISGGPKYGDKGGRKALGAEAGLSEQQLLFLDWLTGDRPEGESQTAFAERIGIDQTRLSHWKRHVGFLTAWEQRMLRTHGSPQILSDQMETVREIIKNGRNESDRLKAVELYWKLLEKMAPNGQIVRPPAVEDLDAGEMTDEQLEAALGAS